MNPKARRDDLLVYEMEDELLIFGLYNDQAHGLSPVAAAVFRACDGSRSVPEIAQVLHDTFQVPQNETLALTALTLDRLTEAGLLEPGYGGAEPTRRELLTRLRNLATISAAMMPMISSITAPPPAMAMSGSCTEGPLTFGDICAACPGGGASYIVYQQNGCTGSFFFVNVTEQDCIDTASFPAVGAGQSMQCN